VADETILGGRSAPLRSIEGRKRPQLPRGRDGTHTDEWFDLHDEMTETYRELALTEATRLMDHDPVAEGE